MAILPKLRDRLDLQIKEYFFCDRSYTRFDRTSKRV